MDAVLGIDLGSTTCKAVILDSQGLILGRGITNTRTNYQKATQIAVHAAKTDAEFALLSHLAGLNTAELTDLANCYRRADYRHEHHILNARLQELAAPRGQPGWESILTDMGDHVDATLRAEPTMLVIADRSRFFKDLVYLLYLEALEQFLPAAGLEEEVFMGLLDQALATVENEVAPLEPGPMLRRLLPPEKHHFIEAMENEPVEIKAQVGTGYGRQLLPFPPEQIRSEILCHARGAHYFFPRTRTVLDIGGQDTKAIQLDADGLVSSFFMNDRCAAGCGRFLGYLAEELAIGLAELGPTACRASRFTPITSTCTVFAGFELRNLMYSGERKEEILLGLHRAIVLRALSLLARSGGIADEFTFTGGVAKNEAVVKILHDLVARNYPAVTINTHADSIFMGALGAALYALE